MEQYQSVNLWFVGASYCKCLSNLHNHYWNDCNSEQYQKRTAYKLATAECSPVHWIFTVHREETVNPTLPYSLYNRVVGFKRSLTIKIMTLLIFLILKPEFVILLQTNQGRKWTLASGEINCNFHFYKQKRKNLLRL